MVIPLTTLPHLHSTFTLQIQHYILTGRTLWFGLRTYRGREHHLPTTWATGACTTALLACCSKAGHYQRHHGRKKTDVGSLWTLVVACVLKAFLFGHTANDTRPAEPAFLQHFPLRAISL